jgi:hypothetical protein
MSASFVGGEAGAEAFYRRTRRHCFDSRRPRMLPLKPTSTQSTQAPCSGVHRPEAATRTDAGRSPSMTVRQPWPKYGRLVTAAAVLILVLYPCVTVAAPPTPATRSTYSPVTIGKSSVLVCLIATCIQCARWNPAVRRRLVRSTPPYVGRMTNNTLFLTASCCLSMTSCITDEADCHRISTRMTSYNSMCHTSTRAL